jgi:hypothetical protein
MMHKRWELFSAKEHKKMWNKMIDLKQKEKNVSQNELIQVKLNLKIKKTYKTFARRRELFSAKEHKKMWNKMIDLKQKEKNVSQNELIQV